MVEFKKVLLEALQQNYPQILLKEGSLSQKVSETGMEKIGDSETTWSLESLYQIL